MGKRRLEPLGIILFAALMSTVSFQLIVEGSKELIWPPVEPPKPIGIVPVVLVAAAILSKAVLFVYCRALSSRSVTAATCVEWRARVQCVQCVRAVRETLCQSCR